MPKFVFQMGVNARCYGSVEAEADTIEAAVTLLTADYVGENIAVSETTWDGLTGLAIIDVADEDGNQIEEEYAGTDLPSEYDPPAIVCPPEVETALRYAYAAIHSLLDQIGQMRGMFNDEDGAIQRAVDDGDAAIDDIATALAKIA